MDNLNNKIIAVKQKLKQEQENLTNIPEWKQQTPEYNKQIELINKLQLQHDELVSKADDLNDKYQNQVNTLEQVNQKLIDNSSNQERAKQKIMELELQLNKIPINFDNIGNSISTTIKKVAKWGAALFSIRSVYSLISNAMSTVSQYNSEVAGKMEAIKNVFALALEPVITKIVNLLYTMMLYVNYIYKAWFGVDLLAKSQSKSLKNSIGSAQKLQKALAGFDEMNVLNDGGTTGVGGAIGGAADFKLPENVEIPKWVDWIAKNKETVLGFFKQLAIIIAGFKIAKFILGLKDMVSGFTKISSSGKGATSALSNFGKFLSNAMIIAGIALIAKSILSIVTGWNDMTPAEKRAELALLALGIAITAFGIVVRTAIDTATLGIGEIIALVVGLLALITAALLSEKPAIKSVEDAEKDLKKATDDLNTATSNYSNTLDNYDNALKRAEDSAKKLAEAERENKITGEDLQKQVDAGKLSYDKMTDAQKEVYKAYIDNKSAQENLKIATDNLTVANNDLKEAEKNKTKAMWESELATAKNEDKMEDYRDAVVDAFEKGELSAEEAAELISKSMSDMDTKTQQVFKSNLPSAIKDSLNPEKYQTFGQKLKNWWNGLFSGFTTQLDVKANIQQNGAVIGAVRPHAKGGIVYPTLQYHASGGIINQPGRGVPITEHIGGEKGPEGIIPLTEEQQMEILGAAIGRYVTINANITNTMNGRVISRELKKIEDANNFVTNS